MSEVVPFNAGLADRDQRRAALERLNEAAEAAETPLDARRIILQAAGISEILKQAKAPYEEAWLAGKASVLASRRLALMLIRVSNDRRWEQGRRGCLPSERALLCEELGVSENLRDNLVRLARVDDSDFQRYIQDRGSIPSMNGALVRLTGRDRRGNPSRPRTWRKSRRSAAGVKTPPNPSLDEAYTLIVRALGHLGGAVSTIAGQERATISSVMDLLYEAEDALKPYRGGYVGRDKAAA